MAIPLLFDFSTYNIHLLLIGLVILLAATIPNLLKNKHITEPIIYIAIGTLIYLFGDHYDSIAALNNVKVIEEITEFVVIVALTNAGLKIKNPFSWKTWKYSFWLLLIAMPITMVASAYVSHWILDFTPAAAILFGALIAPTDPVLASDLQTSKPSQQDSSRTRLALTSEAGINDGLAFPFTYFAIFFITKGSNYSQWIANWFWVDFVYKIAMGIIVGLLLGWLLYKMVFKFTSKNQQSKISRGILSLALTLLPYAIAEILGGYGFIAVFLAASAFSHVEKDAKHMDNLHDFTEEIERIFVALLFVVIGIYMASNFSKLSDPKLLLTALILILFIRPIAGWVSLLGKKDISTFEKFTLSFYGIRGVGSIYYLMYALGAATFPESEKLIQLTAVTIILSVFIHGISAITIQKKLDQYDNVD
ncbi:NhaP-type Na+/H+ or K+/H+ antiporter [Flavobacterium arsenatis]|uniref:NhaP-type Na+/H+ or K+/H+ antiporter n=1 Tax=Flavobacterium arsenatis TaxID=1484332 RepID=A0ABU1TLJ2_9FLAO|nr:sodium:proton antiporter [Flavobacterium arsenatis]MDR6966841.1 NhaP-type Na+/H+ or K+/H+ antiporter [Flavobacterium arsenatis]